MLGIPAPQLGRSSSSRPSAAAGRRSVSKGAAGSSRPRGLGRQRAATWGPDTEAGRHPQDVEQGRSGQGGTKVGVDAIARITQDDPGRHAVFHRAADLHQSNLRLGPEREVLWHPRLDPTGRIAGPVLRQVKLERARSAGWPARSPPIGSRPPGSSPACPTGRNIAAPRQPSGCPSWESWCRR